MKKALLCLALLVPMASFAKDVTATLTVSGWHCESCSSKTEQALLKVKGVKSAKADQEKGTATVTYDDKKATLASLEKAVASAGFAVEK